MPKLKFKSGSDLLDYLKARDVNEVHLDSVWERGPTNDMGSGLIAGFLVISQVVDGSVCYVRNLWGEVTTSSTREDRQKFGQRLEQEVASVKQRIESEGFAVHLGIWED